MFSECGFKIEYCVKFSLLFEVEFFRITDEDEWYISTQPEGGRKGRGGGHLSLSPSPYPPFSFPFSFSSFLHSYLRRKLLEDEFRPFCCHSYTVSNHYQNQKKIALALLKPCVRTCHKFSILYFRLNTKTRYVQELNFYILCSLKVYWNFK